jgi:hypothetical protein
VTVGVDYRMLEALPDLLRMRRLARHCDASAK